ncbi:hypothetical protein HPB51_002091 [Rhipicephalus microplus]|uniref:Uncharacterized protein n=1 Tax=Rhipicephalus microplus TaxID=6941 RepID=A0A9J6E5S7_RHIMP|nr:hypothetical protein HPB51_002091 [Rhipicephalus microplus]
MSVSQLFRHGVDTGHSVCFVEGTLDHDNASVVHSSLEQGCGMARITSSSTSGLQCVCPCGTCAPREGFPECKSRQKVDEELCLAFNTFIACGKLEKSLKADGKVSLCHIASCLSSQGIKGHVIELTNFREGFYFAACTLMKELHLWLCRLSWGTENIKPIVEASRVLNYLLSCIALASSFCFLCVVSDIEKLATITGWVRDLSADGDIESNPGPVSFPTTYEEMSGPTFFDWAQDKEGQGTDMLSGARAFVSNHACADVNTAIINNVLWHSGRLGEVKHLRLGTWTTLLYPTSVHGQQQLLSAADIRREDSRGKHVDSVPFEDLHSLVNPTTSLQGGAFRAKAEPCKGSCLFGVGSAQPNSQARSQPVAKDADAAGRQRQLSHPSPPSAPDVVVAAVGHTGIVLSSSVAMGKGVAFPLSGVGHYPFLRRQGTTAIVIGKGVPNSGALTGLVYAYRIPITVTHKGEEGSGVVRLGGDIVPEEDAVALRALRTENSPTQMLANGSRVSLVGEWLPLKGNGTHTISHIRRWGPPCFVYRPEIAGPGGTTLHSHLRCSD